MYLPRHGKWPSQHLYLKINIVACVPCQKESHESSHVQQSFILQKVHLCLWPCSLYNTLNTSSSAWESVNIWPVFFGITYISNLPTVCVKSSTLVLGFDIWNINFKKISIWFNFKKEILAWIMVNLKTLLILPKTKNLNLLHHVTLKI